MKNGTLQEDESTALSPIKVVRLVLYTLIFLTGLVGNLLVMIVVRARGKRRTFHDYFLLNLAIADLLYILCLPADIYIEMARFPFTEIYCKLIYPLTTFAFSLSILTLTSMAVGRCYIMQGSVRPPIKDKIAILWIAFLWLLSLICVLPLSITVRSASDTCLEDWPNTMYQRAYTVALLVLQYIAPLVTIGIAYIYIGILLIHKKQPKLDDTKTTHRIVLSIRHRNLQIIRTLAVIVVLFAILMLPHEIAWMLIDFGQPQHKQAGLDLIKYSPILTYLHSCSNPLVYGLMISQFRSDVKKCLCCVALEDRPHNDNHLSQSGTRRNPTASAKMEVHVKAEETSWKHNMSSFFTHKPAINEALITQVVNKSEHYETKHKENRIIESNRNKKQSV